MLCGEVAFNQKGVFALEKCNSCSNPFTWKDLYKSFLLNYKPISCNCCGAVNIVNISSRLLLGLFTLMPLFIFIIYFTGESTTRSIFYLLCAIIASIILSSLYPFFARYKLYSES
ncbi:MAG: TIGR04104 family putative zinc finger protein [Heyndrickxia sp.]